MEYSTYWSILDSPSKTIQSNSICLYVAIGAGILWLIIKKFKKDNDDGDKAILVWATGIFSVLGIIGYISLTFFNLDKSNEKTLRMIDASTTPRIVGVVSNFERTYRNARYGRETIEKFTVDSIQFAYGDGPFGKFSSFSKTNNNVIFNGQKVRVTYKDFSPYGEIYKSILKLEIAN